MKRYLTIGVALAVLCGAVTFAQARPPTVTNSPGYDARLRESRKALSGSPTTAPASVPVVAPKRSKKKHTN
ncbi:hypothetical protein QCM77_28360 [Bradyrhizobium sp. SSUT18]|uniref:hypothetical protein n=1 Tax=unclassified Bradyrhizobium TaxID=2631580 RepID=UPI0024494B33|nr:MULTISPECIES: hypothetical protein [unclassified Bradyrhizobium]MDH2348090.1 hypothetical protein [Bradyrhizobium sp. SSUT77]MDH2353875.1 hypothetical protein [Bradyrhizobium sp. SSUT112]MDH2403835.1 hypothetical protein [Bradyrhizobium sp. SSUT18]